MSGRKIKFRSWCYKKKSFNYFELKDIRKSIQDDCCENQPIQQYIGFTDKNLQEIYEGDIVRFQYISDNAEPVTTFGEVYFHEGIFYFDRDLMFCTAESNFILESIEVIGNIISDFMYNEKGFLTTINHYE